MTFLFKFLFNFTTFFILSSLFNDDNNVLLVSSYRIGDAVGILFRSSSSNTMEVYRHQMPRFGINTQTHLDMFSLLSLSSSSSSSSSSPESFSSSSSGPGLGWEEQYRLHHRSSGTNSRYQKYRAQWLQKLRRSKQRPRVSVSFDEGFHHVPWFDVCDFSRVGDGGGGGGSENGARCLERLVLTFVYSGSDGSVHAVHREVRYGNSNASVADKAGEGSKDIEGDIPNSFVVEYVWIEEADVDIQSGIVALFLGVIVAVVTMARNVVSSSNSDKARDASIGNAGSIGGSFERGRTGIVDVSGFAKRL